MNSSRRNGERCPRTRWFGSLTRRVLQVLASAASLNSNDAFLLKTGDDSAHLWMGKGASEEEKKGAEYMSAVLHCVSKVIVEGCEPGLSQHFASNLADLLSLLLSPK